MNKQSAELFTNVDLDRIKRKYVKKPTYTGKHSNIPDTVCKEGSAKRNILRSGKGGNKHIGKSKKINKLYELDDGSDFVEVLSEHDPNYDSEEDTYGKDFQRGIIEGEGSGLSAAEIASRITALIQNYKQDIEHIINVHYLQTLEISPAELVSCHLEQCNNAYDEQLRELQAEEEFGVMNSESLCIPHYEVIKRSIIKSLDYYYDPNALNAENMISGTTGGNGGSGSGGNSNRMEAISLLLVELCANANSSVKYSKCISTGFDKIFEIINELNKDVPCVNALIACYLTRCVVDEIVPPRYIVDWLRKCETMKAECENEEAVNDTAGTEGPDVCDEMNQDKREMVKNIGDIINRTKVHLSHPHYSNKLQHIWGVGSITGDDDGYASEQHIANNIISSTVELKQKIDAILSEYFDNCPCTGVSGASSPGNENGSSNSTEYCYIPPSVSLLTDTYKNMKTLGASAMNYYAHEIVKRAISMVLLNYRAVGPSNPSTVFNQLSKDLSVASAMYIESNTSSLFLCFNTAILFHFLMCGEDKDPLLGVVDAIETVCGCGENSNTIVVPNGACITETTVTSEFLKGIYPQLPPPVVSKLQFFKGLLRFFESHEAIEGNSDGGLSVKYSTESLMYDILLDAPYAHYMLHHILLLSKQNACNLLPSKVPPLPPNSENLCDEVDAFQALVGVLQPYVK